MFVAIKCGYPLSKISAPWDERLLFFARIVFTFSSSSCVPSPAPTVHGGPKESFFYRSTAPKSCQRCLDEELSHPIPQRARDWIGVWILSLIGSNWAIASINSPVPYLSIKMANPRLMAYCTLWLRSRSFVKPPDNRCSHIVVAIVASKRIPLFANHRVQEV